MVTIFTCNQVEDTEQYIEASRLYIQFHIIVGEWILCRGVVHYFRHWIYIYHRDRMHCLCSYCGQCAFTIEGALQCIWHTQYEFNIKRECLICCNSLVSFNKNAETDQFLARNKVEIENNELNNLKELELYLGQLGMYPFSELRQCTLWLKDEVVGIVLMVDAADDVQDNDTQVAGTRLDEHRLQHLEGLNVAHTDTCKNNQQKTITGWITSWIIPPSLQGK